MSVHTALPSCRSALTEYVCPTYLPENAFCIGSAIAFRRGLDSTPNSMSELRDCVIYLPLYSRPYRLKTSFESSLHRLIAAFALIQQFILEKGVLQSTLTIVRTSLIAFCIGRDHARRAASCPRPHCGALTVSSEKRMTRPNGRPRERAHAARTRRAYRALRYVFVTCSTRVLRRAERRV